MMNSNKLSIEPSNNIRKYAAIIFLIFGFLGFCDATYLTIEHYSGVIPPCTIVSGCETVLTSSYATISGMPISVLGMGYYGLIFIFAIAYLDSKKQLFLKIVIGLVSVGFLASLFLVYLQIFVLKHICLYCMFSAITSAVLFVAGCIVLKEITSSKVKIG